MKLHLIQPQELYGPEEREAELLYCWHQNAAIFDVVTAITGRPDFTELFALCKPDAINVIANGDICFDETLPTDMPRRTVYALSRYDLTDNVLVPWHLKDSQDAWMVKGGPHHIDAPVKMGVPGVDNVLAHILDAHYFDVINPCLSIRAIHVHQSGFRTYGGGRGQPKPYRYGPPYKMVLPCSI